MDVGPIYRETRERIADLVRAHAEATSTRVPATPEWTVKDVVGHLSGVCADILAGNLDDVATEPWTAAQVEARKHLALDEILDEWASLGSQVEAITSLFPEEPARQWIADVVTHEHDIRGALEEPGAREGIAMDVAVDFLGRHFVGAASARGLTGLCVQVDGREWATVEGPPLVTLRAAPFEFARATTGRRSLEQLRRLDWSGDPEPYLDAFVWGPFRPAQSDVVEP